MDEESKRRRSESKKIVQKMNTLYDTIKPYYPKLIANDSDGPQKLARFKNIGRELVKASVELS